MARYKVCKSIIKSIKNGRLKEPFTENDFMVACPKFGKGIYNAFLNKHRVGNQPIILSYLKGGQKEDLR